MSLLLLLTNAQAAALLTAWLTDDGTQHLWITTFPWSAQFIETQGEFVPLVSAAPSGPTVAQTAGLWQEQPQAWQDATPWSSRVDDDDDDGFTPLVNAYTGFDIGWDAQADRNIQPTWFRPDDATEGFLPRPNAYTGHQLAEDPQHWQDRTPWYPWTDDEVDGPLALVNAYTGFSLSESPQEWNNWTPWFAPDPEAEGFIPITQPPVTTAQEAGLWQEQPAAWFDSSPWFAPEEQAFGDIPRVNAYAGADIGWDAQHDRSNAQQWFRPDDAMEGLLPIVAAFDPSGFAEAWYEQPGQERTLEARWFHVEDAFESPRPLPNAWAGAELGWDAVTDRANQPQWPTFDIGEGFPPRPNAYAGADIGWDAVTDRSIQPVWPTVDSGSEFLYLTTLVPITVGGRGPTGIAWHAVAGGAGIGAVPSGSGIAGTPTGTGTAPTSGGSATHPKPEGKA